MTINVHKSQKYISSVMPRSHIHGSHYALNLMHDSGNAVFVSDTDLTRCTTV